MPSTKDSLPEFLSALAGEYSFQREIGRGGMGIVYLFRDVQLDRDVAVKVLSADSALGSNARDRFLQEARIAAGLSHPNIVPIHKVGEAAGSVYYVMTFIHGETLGERMRRDGCLPPKEVNRIMTEVAWAAAYAHQRGVVHRDIKPDNILIEAGSGRALVTDFGIAQIESGYNGSSDTIAGTAHFMSPEQGNGASIDGRSDIYSLGVVGYLAASGRLPFGGNSLPEVTAVQQSHLAPPLRTVAPAVPVRLASAIDKCLAADPDDRFQDGEELAAALAAASELRPPLPPSLRSWLAARNPLLVPYLGWSSLFSFLTLMNTIVWVMGKRPGRTSDILLLLALAVAPVFPIIGFHINQASKQFRAGFSLTDLISALDEARRERNETDAAISEVEDSMLHRVLRVLTLAAGSSFVSFIVAANYNLVREKYILIPFFVTLGFGALSNALNVSFVPQRIRTLWKDGIRDRLWRSRAGEWLARRMGAPRLSQRVSDLAFRPTEVALGVAAKDLFAALPPGLRAQLNGIPEIIGALEARAAEARADLALLEREPLPSRTGTSLLHNRREHAAESLKSSVAALEEVRIDLLRLTMSEHDLAPITTLMDNARKASDELKRLAAARDEVNALVSATTD